jgi:cytidylate kinase
VKGNTEALINQQIQRWALEIKATKEAALHPGPDRVLRPIITVSRQLGSGGTEMAEILARRLGYQLVDREVIQAVARETGVQKQLIEVLDERTRNGIEQWVDGVLHRRIFTSEDFIRSLGKVLITVACAGSAVIVGRGANFVLAGEPGFHVRVVGGFDHRVRRLMRVQELDEEEAETKVRKADKNRSSFVERYLHRDINDPAGYHLILNLEEIGIDLGADVVLDLYRKVCLRQ